MKDLNIQVGDRVTHINYSNKQITIIVTANYEADVFIEMLRKNDDENKVLKVERIGEKGWYTVYEKEEKKNLLTEEEREFIKDMCKFYKITEIIFNENDIDFYERSKIVNCPDIPNKLIFDGVKKYEKYTLKDLGLE